MEADRFFFPALRLQFGLLWSTSSTSIRSNKIKELVETLICNSCIAGLLNLKGVGTSKQRKTPNQTLELSGAGLGVLLLGIRFLVGGVNGKAIKWESEYCLSYQAYSLLIVGVRVWIVEQ